MSPEEASNEVLLYRLTAVEEGLKSFSDRVDKRFAEMTSIMQNLAYVPRGEYVIQHGALEQRVLAFHDAAITKAEAADRHAWWAIAMIATTVMGAIITTTLKAAF